MQLLSLSISHWADLPSTFFQQLVPERMTSHLQLRRKQNSYLHLSQAKPKSKHNQPKKVSKINFQIMTLLTMISLYMLLSYYSVFLTCTAILFISHVIYLLTLVLLQFVTFIPVMAKSMTVKTLNIFLPFILTISHITQLHWSWSLRLL